MKQYPIIIIDDDRDDLEIIKDLLKTMNLPNEVYCFDDALNAFEFLENLTQKIFFILCDINMPKLDGFQLREKINQQEKLKSKTIPFLFFSTSGSEHIVTQAYSLNIQGFFKKPNSSAEYKKIFLDVMNYWNSSELP